MAMSFSGAVLTGMGSSFHNGGAKQSVVGSVGFGRKTQSVVVSQRKKSLIYAAGDGNILDDINEAGKKASDFVGDKTKEALAEGEKAKDYVVEKTGENNEAAVKEAEKASDYVADKGKEAAEFVEGKAGEAKDATK